jgi:hypothetical protein
MVSKHDAGLFTTVKLFASVADENYSFLRLRLGSCWDGLHSVPDQPISDAQSAVFPIGCL